MRHLGSRIWFWSPQWYWYGWNTLVPVYFGGDEYGRLTVVFGWTVTGRIIVALSRRAVSDLEEMDALLSPQETPNEH